MRLVKITRPTNSEGLDPVNVATVTLENSDMAMLNALQQLVQKKGLVLNSEPTEDLDDVIEELQNMPDA